MTPAFSFVEHSDIPPGFAAFVRVVARRCADKVALLPGLVVVAQAWVHVAHLDVTVGTYVFKVNSGIAFADTLMVQVIYILFIGVAVLAADEAVSRGARRAKAYALAILAGCTLAAVAAWMARLSIGWHPIEGLPQEILDLSQVEWYLMAIIISTFGVVVYVTERTARLATERMQAAQRAREQARRRTIESRLQAMQARVEPQFLFNALARVKSLYATDAAAGVRMFDDLIAYLRAALPHLRESASTLEREVELARAYLGVLRAGANQAPALEAAIPYALRAVGVPAMTVLPLVDHALVQRRAAGVGGGTLRLEARAFQGTLRISLSDRRPEPGVALRTPIPLGEIEARLKAVYGDRASIASGPDEEGCSRVVIEVPHATEDLPDAPVRPWTSP